MEVAPLKVGTFPSIPTRLFALRGKHSVGAGTSGGAQCKVAVAGQTAKDIVSFQLAADGATFPSQGVEVASSPAPKSRSRSQSPSTPSTPVLSPSSGALMQSLGRAGSRVLHRAVRFDTVAEQSIVYELEEGTEGAVHLVRRGWKDSVSDTEFPLPSECTAQTVRSFGANDAIVLVILSDGTFYSAVVGSTTTLGANVQWQKCSAVTATGAKYAFADGAARLVGLSPQVNGVSYAATAVISPEDTNKISPALVQITTQTMNVTVASTLSLDSADDIHSTVVVNDPSQGATAIYSKKDSILVLHADSFAAATTSTGSTRFTAFNPTLMLIDGRTVEGQLVSMTSSDQGSLLGLTFAQKGSRASEVQSLYVAICELKALKNGQNEFTVVGTVESGKSTAKELTILSCLEATSRTLFVSIQRTLWSVDVASFFPSSAAAGEGSKAGQHLKGSKPKYTKLKPVSATPSALERSLLSLGSVQPKAPVQGTASAGASKKSGAPATVPTRAQEIVNALLKRAQQTNPPTEPLALSSTAVIRDSAFAASNRHLVLDGLAKQCGAQKSGSVTVYGRCAADYFAVAKSIAFDSIFQSLVQLIRFAPTDTNPKTAAVSSTTTFEAVALILTSLRGHVGFEGVAVSAAKKAFDIAVDGMAIAGSLVPLLYACLLHALDATDYNVALAALTVIDATIVALYSHGIVAALGEELMEGLTLVVSTFAQFTATEPGIHIGQLTAHCGPSSNAKKEPAIVPHTAYHIVTGYDAKVTSELVSYQL